MRASESTKAVLLGMLRENTGRHFLDSGGAYGRNWERNQTRDLEHEPDSTYEARVYDRSDDLPRLDLVITHSVFHWLAERVDYAPNVQRMFDYFVRLHDPEGDTHWLQLAEKFVDALMKHERKRGRELGGIYKDGDPLTVNTYNGEDLLSQTLQYVYFDSEKYGEIVLLQIHGGCDARGGYTAPKAFRCSIEDYSILDNAKATVYCEANHEHNWSSDDGCHFYDNGACGRGYRELGDYPAVDVEDAEDLETRVPDDCQLVLEGFAPDRRLGVLQVCDGRMYCPKCGSPLNVSAY